MVLLADSFLERNGTLLQIVVAVALAIAGGVVALVVNRWRERRIITLDYRIKSEVAILSRHERPERLRVLFGDREVSNPFISEIEFRNTGRKAIEKQHFLKPIKIVRPDAKVLDWDITEQSVDDLVMDSGLVRPLDGQPVPEHIEIRCETLNKQDWFVAQIVYDGDPSEPPKISCRILDESRSMREYRSRDGSASLTRLAEAASVFAGAATVFSIAGYIKEPNWSSASTVGAALFGVTGAVGVYLIARLSRNFGD
ncbi:hypothetical protein ACQ86B_17390 [Mycolicibacterium aichiense]|uniref:hypothetical protein n=1 Tax=Mycolicibacterium aichiense TaxID=1799 RepID=UPI003D668168